jgi:serine/threonine protein phosphatase PrpC
MKIIKLLGSEIKKEKKGELSTSFGDVAYVVRRIHDVCGDSAFIAEDKNKLILAVLDGVSGEEGAEAASSVAAVAILNHLKDIKTPAKEDIQEALIEGHTNIVLGFTTALVVVIEKSGKFIIGSVGDTSVYSLDKSGKISLEIQPMRIVGEGEKLFRFFMLRNIVPSVLGSPRDLDIYFRDGSLENEDSLILMSDGITDNLSVIVEEGKVTDVSGEDDLKKIIGAQKDTKTTVRKIYKEIIKRIEDKTEIKEKNLALMIKPDDLAIIGFTMKKIQKTKPKTRNSKRN